MKMLLTIAVIAVLSTNTASAATKGTLFGHNGTAPIKVLTSNSSKGTGLSGLAQGLKATGCTQLPCVVNRPVPVAILPSVPIPPAGYLFLACLGGLVLLRLRRRPA